MAKTREIKGRMKAVANIRRITKTMQMIATSKFARAQQQATAAKPYVNGVFELVRELAATAGDIEHPLINGAGLSDAELAKKPEVILLLTSDRGLCGPYNNNVLRMAIAHLRAMATPVETELVGKKGVNFLRFNKVAVTRQHTHFGDAPRREDVDRLAQEYMDRFIKGEIASVKIATTRFISAGKQTAEMVQLLPLKPPAADDAAKGPAAIYEFTPDRDELLDDLLPTAVKATLNQIFAEAIVSEHVARMIAMKAATDAAGRMGKELSRKFNRARQAQITTELTEIIGGVAALE
ncbi:MAG: ATP synthase F1 subunit gamma [Phycisphaerales bacterium]